MNQPTDLRELVDELQLPAHVHAQVQTGRDAANGTELVYGVVWTDRTYRQCPQCGQPVSLEVECPLMLDSGHPGGRMMPWPQQHGCGMWLSVLSRYLHEPTAEQVRTAAAELAAERDAELATEQAEIRARLADELRHALAEPQDCDETHEEWAERITTGSDMAPGVYRDGDLWVAWTFEPDTEVGDPITVSEEDIRA